MYRALLETKVQPPPYLALSPPPSSSNLAPDNKISPSILLIIIILAIIFFISGLLHLLVRCLLRPPNREPEDSDNATALQGQLQQLFHLHDSGVDQSFIDTLPVFLYKAIIGVKDPFDCAVCLCEFEADDKLRLLPKCSHAFHLECIDTWLLSHSTCPLCRGSLLPDFSPSNSCSPIVLVLESGSESFREIVADREAASGVALTCAPTSQLDALGEEEFGSSYRENTKKSTEIEAKEEAVSIDAGDKVVPVKLGKFRNVDGTSSRIDGSSMNASTSHVDGRRCFSMGSFEYVMDDSSLLQVPIRPQTKKQVSRKPALPLTPGHRLAMSVCDCHSSREGFSGFEISADVTSASNGADKIGRSKRDSFSISKIWLRGPKTQKERASTADANRRAVSFRFPGSRVVVGDDSKAKANTSRRTCPDGVETGDWSNGGGCELEVDEEVGSCNSLGSQANPPSFARRTLLWLAGRQNKVVHSSATSQA